MFCTVVRRKRRSAVVRKMPVMEMRGGHDMASHHVAAHTHNMVWTERQLLTSCHVMSCHVMSSQVISYHIISCPIPSHPIMPSCLTLIHGICIPSILCIRLTTRVSDVWDRLPCTHIHTHTHTRTHTHVDTNTCALCHIHVWRAHVSLRVCVMCVCVCVCVVSYTW